MILPPASLSAVVLGAHEHFADMGPWEWITAVVAALVSAWCIWKSVRYALAPGEADPAHIKRSILEDEPPPPSRAGAAGSHAHPPVLP